MVRLFVYGTLMLDPVQLEIIGRLVSMQPAILDGYDKGVIHLEGGSYPRIERHASHFVEGMVMQVTDDELHRMDIYEGAEYTRIMVTLRDGTQAWVYVKPE